MQVPAADSEEARGYCSQWLALVLKPQWVPSDIGSRFQPVRRHPGGYDLLVAKYAIEDCSFRIWDTSLTLVIEISSSSLAGGVTDWPGFTKGVMKRFMMGCGHEEGRTHLDEFDSSFVCQSADGGLVRVCVSYPVAAVKEENSARYWNANTLTIWREPGKVTIEVHKLPDGIHPLQWEYGLKRRFPPVDRYLSTASDDELIARIAGVAPDDRDSAAWCELAYRALVTRPKRPALAAALLSSVQSAKGADARIQLVNAADYELSACTDPALLGSARQSLVGIAADMREPSILRSTVLATTTRVDRRLAVIRAERVQTGGPADPSPNPAAQPAL